MNNCDERYLSYNPKDKADKNGSGARVCYNEMQRCWIAPGRIKITALQAERLVVKMAVIMGGKS